MKLSVAWLRTYLATDANTVAIARTLTSIGLEVENITDKAALLAPFTVAEILHAAPHPQADKLQVCRVRTLEGEKQIVCGAPNARAGIKVVLGRAGDYVPGLDITLKATTIRGVESHGMLCSASELLTGQDSSGIIELPADAIVGAPVASLLGADDAIIDVAITPNRSDCFSHYGIARDLAAAGLGTLATLPAISLTTTGANPYRIQRDTPACPQFATRLIRGVRNGASPPWLQQRLAALGAKSISAVVDVTNYVLHSLGRPLHAFDAAKITGQQITISQLAQPSPLNTLDGQTHTLPAGSVVISDDSGIISLAGIMGGISTACDATTTDVLLESALFDATTIARTGQHLNILSDARTRFERGVDPALVQYGLDWAAQLISEICGGTVSPAHIDGAVPPLPQAIPFTVDAVTRIGGLSVTHDRAALLLNNLGCHVTPQQVTPPTWRPDITTTVDVVEEILRLEGYDSIPAILLPSCPITTPLPEAIARQARIRRTLATTGFDEVISWSFTATPVAALFTANPIELANPISADLSALRPHILCNLLPIASRNLAKGLGGGAIMESGPIFHGHHPGEENPVTAGVLYGAQTRKHWQQPEQLPDAWQAKQALLTTLQAIGFDGSSASITTDALPIWYHPGQAGTLQLGSRTILGHFGMLHPKLCAVFDLPATTAAFECYLDAVPAAKARKNTPYQPAAMQPVWRDFAFVMPHTTPAGNVIKAIKAADKSLIGIVDVFDVYTGKGIAEGYKSLAISVQLTPQQQSLDDAGLNAISQKIITTVAQKTGATLR